MAYDTCAFGPHIGVKVVISLVVFLLWASVARAPNIKKMACIPSYQRKEPRYLEVKTTAIDHRYQPLALPQENGWSGRKDGLRKRSCLQDVSKTFIRPWLPKRPQEGPLRQICCRGGVERNSRPDASYTRPQDHVPMWLLLPQHDVHFWPWQEEGIAPACGLPGRALFLSLGGIV